MQSQFEQHTEVQDPLAISKNLQVELRQHMISSSQCILPFIHGLPTGQERGKYFALEVEGSNLRMALVDLRGHDEGIFILRMVSFPIDTAILQLKEYEFFD